jgi:hypothetical protein
MDLLHSAKHYLIAVLKEYSLERHDWPANTNSRLSMTGLQTTLLICEYALGVSKLSRHNS